MSQDMLDESSTLESKVCDSIIGFFVINVNVMGTSWLALSTELKQISCSELHNKVDVERGNLG